MAKRFQGWPFQAGVSISVSLILLSGGLSLPAQGQLRQSESYPQRLAQQWNTIEAETPALIFRSLPGERAVNFQLPLPEGVLPPTSRATVLQEQQIGAIRLQLERDRIHDLSEYAWQLEPNSYVYLGRSGYKGIHLHYTYGSANQALSTLRLFCQTLDLRQNGQHLCRLAGTGPLFQGELSSRGRLGISTLEESLTPPLTTEQQQYYDRGFMLGQRDRQINLSADYQRYRSEYTPSFEADFREGYAAGYSNGQPRPQPGPLPSDRQIYSGRGTLLIYPVTPQTPEQRYALTRVELQPESASNQLRLVWSLENQTRSVEMRAIPEATASNTERRLRLTTIDNTPAQGTLGISADGRIRTLERIFMGSNDQELTLDFRPN